MPLQPEPNTAGPYPTKAMFEAMKTRVGTLEDAQGDSGVAPAYLSERVLLDTTGTRPIAPEEIPNELYVRSCTLTLAPTAPPLTFTALESGFSQGFAGLSVYAASNAEALGQGNYDLYSGGTGDGNVLLLPEPLTLPPGGVLRVEYWQWLSQGDMTFRADPVLPPGVSYAVRARDVSGTPVSTPVAALPFRLLTPRTVLGSLAPDAMNVVGAPSALTAGDFEIVDDGSAPPRLRYRSTNDTVYALAMTPES